MGYKLNWTPENLTKPLNEAVAKGLTAGAALLSDTMARNMGSEGGGVVGKTKTGRNIYKASPPGRFPGIRTGNLRNSITYEAATASHLTSVAGTTVGKADKYGMFLEFGTSKMAARPWALRSFNQNKTRIVSVMNVVARREFDRLVAKGGNK